MKPAAKHAGRQVSVFARPMIGGGHKQPGSDLTIKLLIRLQLEESGVTLATARQSASAAVQMLSVGSTLVSVITKATSNRVFECDARQEQPRAPQHERSVARWRQC